MDDNVPTASTVSYACACKDPHLYLAHGGTTDFRGKNNTFYNFLSSKNISLNVLIQPSHFWLDGNRIDGSFVTEVHMVCRTDKGRFFLNVTHVERNILPYGWSWNHTYGSCMRGLTKNPFHLGPGSRKVCDNVEVSV